jgi:phosphate transport system substrate-binding protein
LIFGNKKLKLSWLAITIGILISLVTGSAGCNNQSNTTDESELSGSINVIGSNTVTPLSAVWAEEFMKIHPQVSIAVSGPGSGVGIAALINGTTDICQASRKIKQSEIDEAKANGVDPYEIQVATDALSVVVNFKEHVVQMAGLPTEDTSLEYGPKVMFLPSTEEGVSEVARNPNAIFYPGLGYVTSAVKPLAIKKTAESTGVLPSVQTALDGTYPISRPLLFYTNGTPTGAIKAFVDYCLSSEGQEKVTDVGYVPLP